MYKDVCALGRFGRLLDTSAKAAIIVAAALMFLRPSIAATQITASSRASAGDFDGDNKTDLTVYSIERRRMVVDGRRVAIASREQLLSIAWWQGSWTCRQ